MEKKRVVQPAHLIAFLFVAFLLVGAHGFLRSHPALAGVLLAAFAPLYYFAGRTTGHRIFLYPVVLLLITAYHLLLYAAGVPPAWLPLCSLAVVGVVYALARSGYPRSVAGSPASLYGSNAIFIAIFALWVLWGLRWFFAHAPEATAGALVGYAFYSWLRFTATQRTWHALTTVVLASGGFLFLLHSHNRIGLFVAAALAVRLTGALFWKKRLWGWETFALVLVAAYLLGVAFAAAPDFRLPLSYLALAMLWLQAALALHRPDRLPELLPFYVAGVVLALVPLVLFYPWEPLSLALAYLTIFFVTFLSIARALANYILTLLSVVLSRVLAVLGCLAAIAAFVYLAIEGFPASYAHAWAALGLGLFSLIVGWRRAPRMLKRRNVYVYQAGLFLTAAYFLAERTLAPTAALALLLDSGILPVLAFIATGYWLARRLPEAYQLSLYEVASLAAATACVIHVVRGPIALAPALVLGGLLLIASVAATWKVRLPATLFTVPVVLGLWIYVVESLAGVRGEALGLPYLVFGFLSAAVGYMLLRRQHRWFTLFYFMWFLCTAVALILFYPYRGVGSIAAPLWPVVYLLIARATASRRDLPFALVLEVWGNVLAVASVAVLIYNELYLPTALAFLIYAFTYAALALRHRLTPYLYPAAGSAVAAYFFGIWVRPGPYLFLSYFFPLAALFYFLATLLRRVQKPAHALPFDLAASVGAGVGALLFIAQPFGTHVVLGWLTGLAYLALYLVLALRVPERAFLAGAGIAGAFAIYEFLPHLPGITASNRLGYFMPVTLVLMLLGWWRRRARDLRAGWALYAATIAATAAASLFAFWPAPPSPATTRLVLLLAMVVWLGLLLTSEGEIFVYLATLALAMLAYNFVQTSADVFGQHLVTFFLYGSAVLGLIFLAAILRNYVRFRRPVLFVTPTRWRQRFLYLVPAIFIGLVTLLSWAVDTSSNPYFCGTCHTMEAYFANWHQSAHAQAKVSCADCHYEPGLRGYFKAKVRGFSELVVTLTGTQGYKPEGVVNDVNCLRSGCHTEAELARDLYANRTYFFNHTLHLLDTGRGPALRCTSCHTEVGPERHFGVDTNTCFTCHFQATSETQLAASVGCVTCHGLPEGPQGVSGFDHVISGVIASDEVCLSCHAELTRGTPVVGERGCRRCHLEKSAELLTAGSLAIHRQHVREKGIGCDWCHGGVKHGSP